MSSFNNNTIRVLLIGAALLGGGIYYEGVASKRVEQAKQALRSMDASESQLETARYRAETYISLLENMADQKVDRQEPFGVISEFSPEEIKKIGPLLDTLYQRDGHFFLDRFQLAWRHRIDQPGALPRVVLDLEGRKVLLFSNDSTETASIAAVNHRG